MGKIIVNRPPAKSLIFGIRSIGYSFPTAVADIIDNSIAANATEINMLFDPIADTPYFAVLDNGCGMNYDELYNAMTFGSSRENKTDNERDLGRFGLGLKSASLSQCKVFYVVSKKNNSINAMGYDLDYIAETNEWNMKSFTKDEIDKLPHTEALNQYNSGTLVIWTKFDKLEGAAGNFEKSFRDTVEMAKSHVEFVFHRFRNELSILFNGFPIEERDPFLKKSVGRQQTGRVTKINVDGQVVIVTPYTLPYSNSLTNEEKRLLGNTHSIADNQGFYIYRNKRLIYWGSWMHMGYKSELNKLARVQVDIPSALDELWMLDVKKSYAKIPDKIKSAIKIAVEDSVVKSKNVVTHRGTLEKSEKNKVWNRIFNSHDNTVKYEINRDNPTIKALVNSMDDSQLKLFSNLMNEFETYFPKHSLIIDSVSDVNIINSDYVIGKEELRNNLIDLLNSFPFSEREDVLNKSLESEVFKSLADQKDSIMEELSL